MPANELEFFLTGQQEIPVAKPVAGQKILPVHGHILDLPQVRKEMNHVVARY
jgi:hypothetical protein